MRNAAVWATENTREALFGAMRRKQTYASTCTRMRMRFFGGWNFGTVDLFGAELAATGYRNGVPMSGDLIDPPQAAAPTFLIRAAKDPNGANLDQILGMKG